MSARLGFGCSGLMARLDREQSEALLVAAYDAGIRWFDVARSYGYGEAEAVLGKFLARLSPADRAEVTVVTKAGILPPRRGAAMDVAKAVARRVAALHPALKARIRARALAMVQGGAFAPEQVEASLAQSLAQLGGRVDWLLLHDCGVADLTDPLLVTLRAMRAAGRIGGFGVASSADVVAAACAAQPGVFGVAQFAASPGGPRPAGATIVHHSVVTRLSTLAGRLAADPARARSSLGIDANDRDGLGRALLAAALRGNPDGVVLFSSQRASAIAANARVRAEDISVSAASALAEWSDIALEAAA